MTAVPMKSEYGPTLGRLLAPRWHRASRPLRALVIALCVGFLALAVGLVLTLENAHYSQGGKLPFHFAYRGLHRVPADPGAYVKLEQRNSEGALLYSYEVSPLHLPPYEGELTGELPRYASGYIERLSPRLSGFALSGEGKTRVNAVPAYEVLYTTLVEGREMYGRNVLLAPEGKGVREGVIIAMLTATTASSEIKAPYEVASAGTLLRPLKTFTFG